MEKISNIEKRLWGSADTLRANSNFASNEYFMPVTGLIFLRHAYSRFLKVRDEIIPPRRRRPGWTAMSTLSPSLTNRCLISKILPDATRKRASLFSALQSHYLLRIR